jgi:hypothetical protein
MPDERFIGGRCCVSPSSSEGEDSREDGLEWSEGKVEVIVAVEACDGDGAYPGRGPGSLWDIVE